MTCWLDLGSCAPSMADLGWVDGLEGRRKLPWRTGPSSADDDAEKDGTAEKRQRSAHIVAAPT